MQKFYIKAELICEKNSWIGFNRIYTEAPDSDSAISNAEAIFRDLGYNFVMAEIAKQNKRIEIQREDIRVKILLIKELT